jgi:DNA-binding transcriptional MerR regulator
MNEGSWSTAQVARMSSVTSRTLRHYDDIGLLRPASVGGNGLRWYRREQLLRLQQILLLRDLGLSLDRIATVVNDGADQVEQLRRHHGWLTAERDRFARLAETVAATIEDLEGRDTMRPEQLFDGFDAARQERYEAELVQRYGEDVRPHMADSKRRLAIWSRADADRTRRQWEGFGPKLVELLEAGRAVDDPAVQEVVAAHHQWVCQFWTPDRQSYPGLGQLYVDSPEFRVQFDALDLRLAEYLRDAMAAYAQANRD